MGRPVLGQITLKITCADCTGLLNRMNKEAIRARNIVYQGDLELSVTIAGSDYFRFKQLVRKLGGTVQIKRLSFVHRYICNIKKHPVILSVLLLLLLATVYIPRRVLFLTVSGNITIPANQITEAAERCGLHFGAKRESVRSEVIKNALLEEIPQLQWVGINTRGCTATISVREKTTQEIKENADHQVSSIVALRDGIVQSCTVYQGTPLCATGQAVKAGQTLVSGYTDCGLMIKATRAEAEIKALTFRDLEILSPDPTMVRGQIIDEKNYYAIHIGKKVINLSKDSGNSGESCVKIYSEKSVRLPGGFSLPISIVKTTYIYYDTADQMPSASDAPQWIEDYSVSYLKSIMIAGNVISAQTELAFDEGFTRLRGRFACEEMIGRIKYEQKLLKE